jgi:Asp-tRNA(Asn)/Glu-tRNA(Gln) amidotransferase B subunit
VLIGEPHLESELERHITTLQEGGTIKQATRGFNVLEGQTYHLRSKEDAPDYRYMPDPELGSIRVSSVRSFSPPHLVQLPSNASFSVTDDTSGFASFNARTT